jgi:hypothetical protein
MDKKSVLKQTVRIWDALSENPRYGKAGPEVNFLTAGYLHGTPACSYVMQESGVKPPEDPEHFCRQYCPLWAVWGKVYCEAEGSPHKAWMDLGKTYRHTYDVVFFALLIKEETEIILEAHRDELEAIAEAEALDKQQKAILERKSLRELEEVRKYRRNKNKVFTRLGILTYFGYSPSTAVINAKRVVEYSDKVHYRGWKIRPPWAKKNVYVRKVY